MIKSYEYKSCLLELLTGDITEEITDVVVNAANSRLAGGSGVDGAIHEAGGPEINEECAKIITLQGECPTGESVITSSGKMKCKYIIHTVGPIWSGGKNSEEFFLRKCFFNSLKLAANNGLKTISFPAISTGAYGYPVPQAAFVSIDEILRFIKKKPGLFRKIRIVLFSENKFEEFSKALERLKSKYH